MLETETKITVSRYNSHCFCLKNIRLNRAFNTFSLNDVSSFNMERVITIKGTIENMSRAEGMISAKLRQSYESDLQAMAVRPSFQWFTPFLLIEERRHNTFGSSCCLATKYDVSRIASDGHDVDSWHGLFTFSQRYATRSRCRNVPTGSNALRTGRTG